MDKKHVALGLGAVLAALLAFIVFYERALPSSGELQTRERHWLSDVVRDRITRIEIHAHGKRVTLTTTADANGIAATDEWQLLTPTPVRADNEAVQSMLGMLEWADPRRTFENVDAATLHTFGLDHPRCQVTLTMGRARMTLAFGAEDPRGEGFYAQILGKNSAFVVGKDILEGVDYDANHFRAKELFGTFSLHRTSKFSFGSTAVRRDGNRWFVATPEGDVLGDRALIESVLTDLDDVRATRFLDGNADRAALGLTSTHTLSMELRYGTAPDAGVPENVSIALGGACPEHADEAVVALEPSHVVACVPRAAIGRFANLTANDLPEAHVLPFDDEIIDGITISTPNDASQCSISFAKLPQGPLAARANHCGNAPVEVEIGTSRAYLRALHELKASSFVPVAQHDAQTPETARIEVRVASQPALHVSVFADSTFVRQGEGRAWQLTPEQAERLVPSALNVRSSQVLDIAEDTLAFIEWQADPATAQSWRLDRSPAGWRPSLNGVQAQAPFDAVTHGIVERVRMLSAVRWTSSTCATDASSPTLRIGDTTQHVKTFVIGRLRNESCTSVDGQTFIIDASLRRDLESWLISAQVPPPQGPAPR